MPVWITRDGDLTTPPQNRTRTSSQALVGAGMVARRLNRHRIGAWHDEWARIAPQRASW